MQKKPCGFVHDRPPRIDVIEHHERRDLIAFVDDGIPDRDGRLSEPDLDRAAKKEVFLEWSRLSNFTAHTHHTLIPLPAGRLVHCEGGECGEAAVLAKRSSFRQRTAIPPGSFRIPSSGRPQTRAASQIPPGSKRCGCTSPLGARKASGTPLYSAMERSIPRSSDTWNQNPGTGTNIGDAHAPLEAVAKLHHTDAGHLLKVANMREEFLPATALAEKNCHGFA